MVLPQWPVSSVHALLSLLHSNHIPALENVRTKTHKKVLCLLIKKDLFDIYFAVPFIECNKQSRKQKQLRALFSSLLVK